MSRLAITNERITLDIDLLHFNQWLRLELTKYRAKNSNLKYFYHIFSVFSFIPPESDGYEQPLPEDSTQEPSYDTYTRDI